MVKDRTIPKPSPGEYPARTETANNHVVSVRALLYHMAGHELHHLHIIEEKYLSGSRFKG
jgi:hypothetical protein